MMARSLFPSLNKAITTVNHHHHHHCLTLSPSSRLLSLRTQSSQPDLSDLSSSDSTTDPLLSKLEDAIHRIIVRRSAPDWLPFLPGSSYWVPPPKSEYYGVAQLVEKLANPLTPEQAMSTNTVRGWPSSDYFIKGATQYSVEAESIFTGASQSEDEEG